MLDVQVLNCPLDAICLNFIAFDTGFKHFYLSVKNFCDNFRFSLKDGLSEEVVLVSLDISLVGLLDIGPEGGGVAGHLRHEVQDRQAVDPGVRGSDGLEDVFVEVAGVVEDLEHRGDALVAEFIRFKIVIDGGFGEDGENVVEQFGAPFPEHLLGDDSELHGLLQSADFVHDPGDHLGYLLFVGLFEVGVLREGVVVGVVGCAFVFVGGGPAFVLQAVQSIHF